MISFTRSAPEWTLVTRFLTCRKWLNFPLINTLTSIWALRLITRFYLHAIKGELPIYFSFNQKFLIFDFTVTPTDIFCRWLSHLQIPFQNTMFWSAILRII
jgi:hypothetical protein